MTREAQRGYPRQPKPLFESWSPLGRCQWLVQYCKATRPASYSRILAFLVSLSETPSSTLFLPKFSGCITQSAFVRCTVGILHSLVLLDLGLILVEKQVRVLLSRGNMNELHQWGESDQAAETTVSPENEDGMFNLQTKEDCELFLMACDP